MVRRAPLNSFPNRALCYFPPAETSMKRARRDDRLSLHPRRHGWWKNIEMRGTQVNCNTVRRLYEATCMRGGLSQPTTREPGTAMLIYMRHIYMSRCTRDSRAATCAAARRRSRNPTRGWDRQRRACAHVRQERMQPICGRTTRVRSHGRYRRGVAGDKSPC